MCMYLEIITKSTYMYIDYCCSKGIAHAHAMTICIDVTSPWGAVPFARGRSQLCNDPDTYQALGSDESK